MATNNRQQPQNLEEVRAALAAIDSRLEASDEMDAERRKLDDLRYQTQDGERKELLQRIGGISDRTSKLESNWDSFFGEQGAFPMVVAKIDGHGKKIDRLMWFAGVIFGIGLVLKLLKVGQ